MIYGFVATLAKVVIERIKANDFDWLTILCIVALLAAVAIGAYFVQTAYAVGPPDLVIAGLTVIDPIVAVFIGLTILQEAANAPVWAFFGFAVAGAIAVDRRHHARPASSAARRRQPGASDPAGERAGSGVGRRHERLTRIRDEGPLPGESSGGARNDDHETPVLEAATVSRCRRRSRELDLRLPVGVRVLGGRAPDRIHP